MFYDQRKAKAACTEAHTNIIHPISSLMEKYWRPFYVAATKQIWAALYDLGSSFTEAHESTGGTWDSQCRHDLSQSAQVSVTLPCCQMSPSLPQLQIQSHWSDWMHSPTAYTAHTVALTAYRCLPPLGPVSIPTGCLGHWIELFVPNSELGLSPYFLLTQRTTLFWEDGNLISLDKGTCMSHWD